MSILDYLGSVFGGSGIPSAMGNMRLADFGQAIAAHEHARFTFLAYQGLLRPFTPVRILPEGIFWERTGGKTHRVTIRRKAEAVVDLSGLGNIGGT